MRKYIILFFSGSLLLFACHKSAHGVIKPDVMINLLTDIHLADGEMMDIPQIPDSMYKYGMGKYMQVFKKYQVDTADFRTSYKYYTMHPDDMVSIYDAVLKKLTVKSDSVTALIAKNNTAQMKKNQPGKAVGGKFAPAAPGSPQSGPRTPMEPVHPSLPGRPGLPNKSLLQKQQILERTRMQRDSMIKHTPRNKHAVSV